MMFANAAYLRGVFDALPDWVTALLKQAALTDSIS
jgi:hypothetical protein